ncbi:MAG: TIGR04086 family membrane protein [Clostridia bacterium]|nr:TIGR04086 family membrane protein [Clostridia bacterium]
MIKVSETLGEGGNSIKKILIGSGVSIAITIIGLIIFASLLTYSSIAESTIPTVTIIITIISILIGSSLCMSTVKKNGIINGVLIGLIYISFIYILSSIIEGDFSLNLKSIIMIIGALIAGAVGGIIGVNRR